MRQLVKQALQIRGDSSMSTKIKVGASETGWFTLFFIQVQLLLSEKNRYLTFCWYIEICEWMRRRKKMLLLKKKKKKIWTNGSVLSRMKSEVI